MYYHLHRGGQPLGIFSLKELNGLRSAGELDGCELVWAPGMEQWKSLDSVLQGGVQESAGSLQPEVPRKKPQPVPVLVALVIVGFLLLGAIVAGVVGYHVLSSAVRQAELLGNKTSPFAEMSALEAATKPVQPNVGITSPQMALKMSRDFCIRQYLDGYKLRGERNPESDALALGFLQNQIASDYGITLDTKLLPLNDLATQLAKDTNCTDPIVLAMAGKVDPELHDATRRLDRALTGFQHSKHLAYPKLFAILELERKILQEQQNRIPVLDAQALQYLKESFADGSLKPDDQLQIGEGLILGTGAKFFNRNGKAITQIVRDQGKPYQWLALTLEGESEIGEAWKERGGGFSYTVTDVGIDGFYRHLALARKALVLAWKVRPDLPLAPCRLIYVSLGDSGIGEMRLWFDRTMVAQINYSNAWSDMRWGLRPRWYGDINSMLAFGLTALNTKRFDTDVPRGYFESVKDVEDEMDLPRGQHIYGREDIWPHLQELYEGYIAEPSVSEYDRIGWRNAYAIVAFIAGKYEVARKQLEAINWQMRPFALTGWGLDLSLMPQEVAARTGADSNAVNAAESLSQSGDIAGALKSYTALEASTSSDAMTHSFVQDRLATLGLEQRLRAGEWVDFLPSDNNFIGWHVAIGKCEVLPDGSLQVSSNEGGHILYSRVRIGTDFEVRGQFDVVSSTSNAFQGGLVMGLPQFETYNWYGFRMKRNSDEGDVVTFSEHWSQRQLLAPISLDSRTNTFTFRFQNGLVSATVDGREVFHDVEPPEGSTATMIPCYLGLGAFNHENSSVIRYRNIQVRKLPSL